MFSCINTFDFTGYDMRDIIQNSWSHCHIQSGAITFDEFVYKENNGHDK